MTELIKKINELIEWRKQSCKKDISEVAVFEDKKGNLQIVDATINYDDGVMQNLELRTFNEKKQVTSSAFIMLDENSAYLSSIATFFDFRNTGIASKVLEFAEIVLAKNNVKDIVGIFAPNNPFYDAMKNKNQTNVTLNKQANAFYKKHNFDIITENNFMNYPRKTALMLRSNLKSDECITGKLVYKVLNKNKTRGFTLRDGLLLDNLLIEKYSNQPEN